jgi:2'-5' RNA ligase
MTVLVIPVPAAEPIVGRWRSLLDPAASAGMPAHITVLAPFLNRESLSASVLAELAGVIAGHKAFGVQLQECRRFPAVLYLAPEPDTGLRALTEAIAARWPEAPPYGGQFADIVPHLTIAHSADPRVLDEIEAGVRDLLPIPVAVSSVQLMVHTGKRWQADRSFALGGGE